MGGVVPRSHWRLRALGCGPKAVAGGRSAVAKNAVS